MPPFILQYSTLRIVTCHLTFPLMTMGSFCRCVVALLHLANCTGCRAAAIVAPLHLTSGPARCEAALHGCGRSPVCLFYAITTVFQLYHGGDMMTLEGESPSLHFYQYRHCMRETGLWWHCKLYIAVEIQISRGDGMGNQTADLQIRSRTP